jgi:hypothetical protein
MFRADIGGFSAGCFFSWNVIAAYNFNICIVDGVTYFGMLGYRALSVDYENGASTHGERPPRRVRDARVSTHQSQTSGLIDKDFKLTEAPAIISLAVVG